MSASFASPQACLLAPAAETVQRVLVSEALAELKHVPQNELETVYAEACARVNHQDFEGAMAHLQYLVVHDPYDFRFQFGFGLCLHQLGSVTDAFKHYGLAWVLDPSDAACAFRLGECHAAMGDHEAAYEAFQTAIVLCSPPSLRQEIRIACEAALAQLSE